jgi:hypothetical protein
MFWLVPAEPFLCRKCRLYSAAIWACGAQKQPS